MMPPYPNEVQKAFAYCQHLVRSHYENFPVASLFIPRRHRPFVSSVYAFARIADDFADEGNMADAERLALLDQWQERLDRCASGSADHPVFIALAETLARTGAPLELFSDLLVAFRMDVTKKRHATFRDLLYYCRHSANPVGRIVLHIFNEATEEKMQLSDSLCTALQLANFWQDVSVDFRRGRIYVPLEDLERFGYTETTFAQSAADEGLRNLVRFELDRTREIFSNGKPLLRKVGKQLRLEMLLTWNGGMTILRKIEAVGCDVLSHRPRLTARDKLLILGRSLFGRTL